MREQQKKREEMEDRDNADIKDVDIDFQQVVQLIQDEIQLSIRKQRKRKKSVDNNDSASNTIPMRAVCDYRNKFITDVSPSINKRPFTKEESLKIFELLHQHNGHPPWHLVALTLNTNRTPFQCFKYAQRKLLCNPLPWNREDDELLLKLIAASGPQIVLNNHTATFICHKFFPHFSRANILHRCNETLVNPNLENKRWSEEEERLLVLGMRVFSEAESPINRAAVRYLPPWFGSFSIFPFVISAFLIPLLVFKPFCVFISETVTLSE